MCRVPLIEEAGIPPSKHENVVSISTDIKADTIEELELLGKSVCVSIEEGTYADRECGSKTKKWYSDGKRHENPIRCFTVRK